MDCQLENIPLRQLQLEGKTSATAFLLSSAQIKLLLPNRFRLAADIVSDLQKTKLLTFSPRILILQHLILYKSVNLL